MTAVRVAEEFGYDLVSDHGREAHLVVDFLAMRDMSAIIGLSFPRDPKLSSLTDFCGIREDLYVKE